MPLVSCAVVDQEEMFKLPMGTLSSLQARKRCCACRPRHLTGRRLCMSSRVSAGSSQPDVVYGLQEQQLLVVVERQQVVAAQLRKHSGQL